MLPKAAGWIRVQAAGGRSRRAAPAGVAPRRLVAPDLTLVELLAARRARRRARAAPRPGPAWARARGWSRCPSCLSTRLRTSGEEPDPDLAESPLSLEAVGYVGTALGRALVGLAAASLAGAG